MFYCIICRRSKINCYFETQDCRVYTEFFYYSLNTFIYRKLFIVSLKFQVVYLFTLTVIYITPSLN